MKKSYTYQEKESYLSDFNQLERSEFSSKSKETIKTDDNSDDIITKNYSKQKISYEKSSDKSHSSKNIPNNGP